MKSPKDETSHWDELLDLVDEHEELERENASSETSPTEGAEQHVSPSTQTRKAGLAADSMKAWILLASIPITLFLTLGFLGLKAYSDLSESIRGVRQYVDQKLPETQRTQAEQTEQTEEASSELRVEHTKLEQKLVAAEILSAQLEQQVAAAQGQPPKPEQQIADTQTPAQSSTRVPEEENERIESPRSYRLGMQGPVVARIQKRLQELGYYNDEADGVFNRRTRNAVRAFQRSEKLRADGVVGGKTLKQLLFEDLSW